MPPRKERRLYSDAEWDASTTSQGLPSVRVQSSKNTPAVLPDGSVASIRPDGRIERRGGARRQSDKTLEGQGTGYNREFLRRALISYRLPRVNTRDPQAVCDRVEDYFAYCEENDMRPMPQGLALHLGVDKRTLDEWRKGKTGTPEHKAIMEQAWRLMELAGADAVSVRLGNPAGDIFLMKNSFGYQDTVTVQAQQANPLGEEVDAKQLEERYATIVEEDDPKPGD